MCVYSMVSDHFEPRIPKDWQPDVIPMPWQPSVVPFQGATFTLTTPVSPPATKADIDALREEVARLSRLVSGFLEAKAAAEKVDRLTGQPDCVDPAKATLEQRVLELERRLDAVRAVLG